MRWRSIRRFILLTASSTCLALGMSCKDTVREAVFTGTLGFVRGQVNNSLDSLLLSNTPFDTLISGVLNPFNLGA